MARPRIYDEPRVTTAVRLSPGLRAQLHAAAKAEGRSVNQLVVAALSEYLGRVGTRRHPGTPGRAT